MNVRCLLIQFCFLYAPNTAVDINKSMRMYIGKLFFLYTIPCQQYIALSYTSCTPIAPWTVQDENEPKSSGKKINWGD